MKKYYIKSEDWGKIYEFLKTRTDILVKNEEKTRSFAEGVYFIMRTDAQWRELPSSYGKWRSVHKRFEKWARKGLRKLLLLPAFSPMLLLYFGSDRFTEPNTLSKREDIRTGNESKLRLFIEAVWFISRSGCQWRLLPEHYGSWRAVHHRFKRWSDKGVWSDLLLNSTVEADMESVMIDSTIVRSHACSAGYKKNSHDQECLGRSKGGFTTKIHAVVDALGNPLKFILTPGQRNDITQAESLIKDFKNTMVIADKGFDSNALIDVIANNKSEAVIPSKKNRKVQREYDVHVYKERHLIECFFGKIKHFRRIFSRFDKTALSFMRFLNFVATLICLR